LQRALGVPPVEQPVAVDGDAVVGAVSDRDHHDIRIGYGLDGAERLRKLRPLGVIAAGHPLSRGTFAVDDAVEHVGVGRVLDRQHAAGRLREVVQADPGDERFGRDGFGGAACVGQRGRAHVVVNAV